MTTRTTPDAVLVATLKVVAAARHAALHWAHCDTDDDQLMRDDVALFHEEALPELMRAVAALDRLVPAEGTICRCTNKLTTAIRVQRGDRVLVRSAFNEWLERRALSEEMQGKDFPVIWVCTEAEWQHAAGGHDVDRVPWPADEVRLHEYATAPEEE
jgi:hypothetical protein